MSSIFTALIGLQLSILAGVSFVVHFLWERAHVSLYGGYEHITRLPITLYATVGDVAYTLGAVLAFSLYKGGFAWLKTPSISDLSILAIAGLLIALCVEYKALALHKWYYLDTMPMIPILNVGLTPIVQMTILLPLTVWFAGRVARAIFGQ